MADDCLPQVHAAAMRVARLGPNGAPLAGPDNLYVTDALTELTFEPEIADGDEIEEKNANGDICVAFQADPSLKWVNVTIEICTPDPWLESWFSQGTVIEGVGQDDPAGYAFPAIGPISSGGLSVELWTKRINNGDLDPDFPYAHWALPKIVQLRPGSRTFGAESQKPTFTGRAVENPNWNGGPIDDFIGPTDRAAQWVPATSIPTIGCGPDAIPEPGGG